MIEEIVKQMQNDYHFSYLVADIGTFTTTLYFKDNKFAIIHEGTTVTTYENIGGELFKRCRIYLNKVSMQFRFHQFKELKQMKIYGIGYIKMLI